QGLLRHQQFGEGDYEEAERVIQQLLAEAGNGAIGDDLVTPDAHGAEAAPDWEHLASGETYVGHERAENFASPGGAVVGERHLYVAPEWLSRNQWALVGEWTVERGLAALNAANGRIAYRFHARDVHLIMGSAEQGKTI